MNIITQLSIFDYSEIEILGDLERCKLLIDNVPDEKIVRKLEKIRGKGRNDYPVIPVWNSILVMPLLECSTVEQLRRELSRNRDLRKICGFNDADYYYEKCKLVPPPKAYSNMFKNLKEIEPMLKDCFNELRDFMYEHLENYGVETGEDGKIFLSKAKGKNTGEVLDNRSETDADYTIKENYYKDKDGVTQVKKKTYFGFRYHLLGDLNYELPIEYTVTKASVSEKKELMKHLAMLPKDKIDKIYSLAADKGYDDSKVIDKLVELNIKPVIDIRNLWKNKEQTLQYKDTDIVYDYKGTVYMTKYERQEVILIPMKYLGYDKIKNTLRYGYEGKTYNIDVSYDTRVFTPISRDSKKWQRLYNKRTALERINGRMDRDFNLENHKVRGLKKATVLIDIMFIGMMSMAKGHILKGEVEKIRKIKS